jgi:hypothetical protein
MGVETRIGWDWPSFVERKPKNILRLLAKNGHLEPVPEKSQRNLRAEGDRQFGELGASS